MPYQTAISRQSPTNRIGINSSQIRGNTLPIKTVIDNILSGEYLQDPSLDEEEKKLFSILAKLWDELPVDNLGKEGGNFSEKST